MPDFKPSQRILETICSEGNLIRLYTTIPPEIKDADQAQKIIRLVLRGVVHQISEYYRIPIIRQEISDKIILNSGLIVNLLGDIISNSIDHGSMNRFPIEYGLFIGENGICHGVKDGGNFFKSLKIKKDFEEKREQKYTGQNLGLTGSGAGFGIGVIYTTSNLIEVDEINGILYATQLKSELEFKC